MIGGLVKIGGGCVIGGSFRIGRGVGLGTKMIGHFVACRVCLV